MMFTTVFAYLIYMETLLEKLEQVVTSDNKILDAELLGHRQEKQVNQ